MRPTVTAQTIASTTVAREHDTARSLQRPPGATVSNHPKRSRTSRSSKTTSCANLGTNSASARAQTVASWFDITLDAPLEPPLPDTPIPLPEPGQILLFTGPSGAGKSTTLRHLRSGACDRPWRDVVGRPWGDGLVIDQFGDDVESALRTLGQFGLGEAHTYLCPPGLLSDGQQWRLRLARAVHDAGDAPGILVADEFAAILDRVTALVVARALRRAITATPSLAAVVATGHDDLEDALQPDIVVHCDFGKVVVSKAER